MCFFFFYSSAADCDFSTHDVHQKDKLSSFAKRNEKSKENCNFRDYNISDQTKKASKKRANVCSSLGFAPATVSTITANAEKINNRHRKLHNFAQQM
jgi:hypothetical protein